MQQITVDGPEVIEWLRQRNKVTKDWAHKLKVVKLKQEEVLAELRKANIDGLADLLSKDKRDSEATLNYADLSEIQTLLFKSKEAEAKTLFGGFSSPLLKSFQALMRLYQKDNLHIVSLAHEMSQIVSFDLVAAKRSAKSYEQQITDLTAKIGLFEQSIKNSRHEVVKLAKRYASDFEVDESAAEKMDFSLLINSYMRQFGDKGAKVVQAAKALPMERVCDYYARFGALNDHRPKEPKAFDVLIWLSQKGDTLVSDFDARKVSTGHMSPQELYAEILAQKGYRAPGKSQNQEELDGELISDCRAGVADRGRDCGRPALRAAPSQPEKRVQL